MNVQNPYPTFKKEKIISWLTYFHNFIHLPEKKKKKTIWSCIRDLFFSDFICQLFYLGTVSSPLPLNLPDLSIYFLYLFPSLFTSLHYNSVFSKVHPPFCSSGNGKLLTVEHPFLHLMGFSLNYTSLFLIMAFNFWWFKTQGRNFASIKEDLFLQ